MFSLNSPKQLVFQSIPICFLLSSCGGDTGGGDTIPPIPYSEYQAQYVTLHSTWGGVEKTDPTTLPLAGGADYSGVMQLTMQTGLNELNIVGTMNLNVDFSSDFISGSVSNFTDENSIFLNGSLMLSGGVIERDVNTATDYTYSANLDGALMSSENSYIVTSDVVGDFLGLGFNGSSGNVSGSAITSYGNGYLFGNFIVEE